jgi:hypothetical protein
MPEDILINILYIKNMGRSTTIRAKKYSITQRKT